MRREGLVSTTKSKRTTISFRRWPVENPRASLTIVHGYADHSGRYFHVAEYLNRAGISVCALDLRGHGQSKGKRGFVWRFSDYLDNLDALFHAVGFDAMCVPRFLLGHSMGGLVVLNHAIHRKPDCDGIVISSPFLGVAIPVPPVKIALGRIMSVICPWLALPSGINPSDLSHDPAVGESYAKDPLVFKTATARWYTEAMRAIGEVKARAREIMTPSLFLQAGEDRLADPSASEPVFNQLGAVDKKFVRYPAFYHEIFNEIEREEPLREMRDWILERAARHVKQTR